MTMFNGDILRELPKGSKVYLTEGAFDTMAAVQKGGLAVSINSATLFQPDWVALFKDLAVVFILDNDRAGQATVEQWAPTFRREGIPVFIKQLPANCKDVNEWLIKWGSEVNGYPASWDQ